MVVSIHHSNGSFLNLCVLLTRVRLGDRGPLVSFSIVAVVGGRSVYSRAENGLLVTAEDGQGETKISRDCGQTTAS